MSKHARTALTWLLIALSVAVGCTQAAPPPTVSAAVAATAAAPQALDEGPAEAAVVFQAPGAPAPKAHPKPDLARTGAPKAEPPKAEPPKVEPPKVEPAKAEPPKVEPPKAGTLPVGSADSGTVATGTKPTPPRPPRVGTLPPGNFDATTATAFREIAVATGGGVFATATAGGLPGTIARLLTSYKDIPDLDMAFLIDATGSMNDDMAALRGTASSMLAQAFARPGTTRVAVVYYKDHGGECPWVTRIEAPFTEDKGAIAGAFARANIGCGGDDPEHVYAGIYKACTGLTWRPEAVKLLVLIGDAPPQEKYADFSQGMAMGKAKSLGIGITTIIVGK